MLDRADDPAASPQAHADTQPRPVTFRGAGFVPGAGRYSGWIALVLSIGLWHHLSVSVMRIGTGWILGTVAGVIVGFPIGLSSLARGVGITFISALFPIPKIALLPLLIL